MQRRSTQTTRKLLAALTAAGLTTAFGQTTTEGTKEGADSAKKDEVVMLNEYVVVTKSLRESMISAQEKKKEKLEVTDSIVADDINKLPDLSVTEALQRITGIQIARDRGEGSSVAIRGLTQTENLLDGREVFTAGSGRTLNMADIPAETIGGLDVYKSSSANLIEGGIGGIIDVRTRKPFDFKGRELVLSGRAIYGNLVDETNYQYSGLFSDRWKVGDGELGFLVNATRQNRSWREDAIATGAWYSRTLTDGTTVVSPNGSYETGSYGTRKRDGVNMSLQWRPTPELEFYVDGSFAQFKTLQETYGMSMTASSASVASYTLFPGSSDIKSATFKNNSFTTLSFVRNTVDKNRLLAVGAKWKKDDFSIKADASYTDSFNNLYYAGINLTGTVDTFTQDLSSTVPTTGVSGTDLSSPRVYKYATLAYRVLPYTGDLKAAALDAEYKLGNGFFRNIMGGMRYAQRHADNRPGLAYGDASVSTSVASLTKYAMATPVTDLFSTGTDGTNMSNYLVGNLAYCQTPSDMLALRNAFGITASLPTAASSALSLWSIDEDTGSVYLMSRYSGTLGLPVSGNVGVRVVRTEESVSGAQTDVSTGGIKPIDIDSKYHSVLPSMNTRISLQEDLYLRVAASKSVTRPNFSQLSPSLTLIQNPTNAAQNQGSAGNPDLNPVKSDNLDISIEKYFSKSTSVYAACFLKNVDGFIANATRDEVVDGVTYAITRPYNTGSGKVKGVELGYQQFFSFLPGWLSGLGVQANYTYVDSATASSVLGYDVPLEGLSRNSCNVILMWEHKKFATRLAYNWREKFYSGSSSLTGVGAVPVYTDGYGWLDASVSYDLTKRVRLTLEGSNLLNTVRSTYYGIEQRRNTSTVNDVQVIASVTIRL